MICSTSEPRRRSSRTWPVCATLSKVGVQVAPEFLTYARRSRLPNLRSLRDKVLKKEVGRALENQLLGSAGLQDAHDVGAT